MALHLPPHIIQSEAASPVLSVSLNADSTLFGSAERGGWRIWETATRDLLANREEKKADYTIALPLLQSNIIILVGGPAPSSCPQTKVVFWDEEVEEAVIELDFEDGVVGLAARSDRLIIVLPRRVYVYGLGEGLPGTWREAVYETTLNPRGLIALATEPNATLLAFPGRQAGYVQLVRLPQLQKYPLVQPSTPVTTFPSTSILIAHTSALAALCCTPSGHLVATASSKGTLVRVWDVATSQLIRELRRGTDTAEIFGLSLRPDGGALAVSSDKGTVHVWRLTDEVKKSKSRDEESSSSRRPISLSTLKPYLPKYFSSEWSHSQFRLPPPAVPVTRFTSVPDEAPTIGDDICTPFWLPPLATPSPEPSKFNLMLLTQSGGLFRISLGHQPPGKAKGGGDDKGKGPAKPMTPQMWGPSDEGDLKLEEYRRWGGEPGWDW